MTVDGEVPEGSRGHDRRRASIEAVSMVETEEWETYRDGRHATLKMANEIVLPD